MMFCSEVWRVALSLAVAKLVLVASDTWDGFFFLSGEEEVLKENLELNRHYRGVNYQVWNLL